ncbi:trehalose phosphorylase [Dacryopinax primogenitus]|uniref:Trehalose phosphorylase n=1 Tax=Dacryopinax primogenitus (strain DJM 731) TaxID=1858805 RepID=M5FTT0_DACPD|nr:trehalose phosphorylase [Dacryopinax primogenitus]EJT99528.1 trehalose phosphorylase [Dacryopinax primogenitus]
MHIGLAAKQTGPQEVEIGYSISDGVYSIDYAVHKVDISTVDDVPHTIAFAVLEGIMAFSGRHMVKFVCAGVGSKLVGICPRLPSLLWSKLDIIPYVMPAGEFDYDAPVDELADSMVRKATMWIGPQEMPRLDIAGRNVVNVDGGGIKLCDLQDYERSVGEPVWRAVSTLCQELKERQVKVRFFSATPQGGGVALMRHALVRFFRLMGVDCQWFVPKPNPAVFRVTKTNHNILQGVAEPNKRLGEEDKHQWDQWIQSNADRYWFRKGGPLADGGADVVIIDDPQMIGLIPMIKERHPTLPVIYRSHIEIRSDLTKIEGSPQQGVWQFLWKHIKPADLFIAHPVAGFIPTEVNIKDVGLMPATTDWLDGLNKPIAQWDTQYYFRQFANGCLSDRMTNLAFPSRGYICQVARFDPSKGIPDVLDSYAKLRQRLEEEGVARENTPQLLICGHGAIDDPDGTFIYDETCQAINTDGLRQYKNDIIVMRLGPSDQILNVLLSNSRIALQLSHREGFEVKVSEALHKNIPTVAYASGGIPLQIRHGHNGFLVKTGDTAMVAQHLYDLWMNTDGIYEKLQAHTDVVVSDEVSTVGNATCWAYLAGVLSKGEKLQPNGRWIYDMAREAAGVPVEKEEQVLPRKALHLDI